MFVPFDGDICNDRKPTLKIGHQPHHHRPRLSHEDVVPFTRRKPTFSYEAQSW